ncbi:MAG TPA: phasin family protein [Caulobacteraceae bacterium]
MATTAHSAKAAADQAADFGYDAFKTTVDRSMAAFDGIAVNSKLNLEALADAVGAAAECAQTLSAQAAAYGKKAMEDHLTISKQLATAKSVQEAFDIQTGYAKSAMEGYLSELTRWSDSVTASMQRSMKPINERVAAAAEQYSVR